MSLITLKYANQNVTIDAGELISFQAGGCELIHQKGSPGWASSDTEMFPIIGPLSEANYMVQVTKGSAVLDQHGHLRCLAYDCISNNNTSAIFIKEYQAGTPVTNPKYPVKSKRAMLAWPYTFSFEKRFDLDREGLKITFTINGEKDMPYMLGYHPAFKLTSANSILCYGDKNITLEAVLNAGSRALEIPNCNLMVLQDNDRSIEISTEGFKHFMCWTEVNNMICVEPITFYPYTLSQGQLHLGFSYLKQPTTYKVRIKRLA